MNGLQIALICILALLGISFIIMIYVKFHETSASSIYINKKKKEQVEQVLENYDDVDDLWDHIWPLYYKAGHIKYFRIDSTLSKIVNESNNSKIRNNAIIILREKVSLYMFEDDNVADAIIDFRRTINICGQNEVKEAGNKLIKEVQVVCQKDMNSQKYDTIIQWIFNAIEVVGFILAIVTL